MDQDLTVNITGKSDSAVSSGSAVVDVLTQLEAAFERTAVASEATAASTAKLAEAHHVAAGAAAEHAEAETIFGATVGKAEGATNALSRALYAVGLDTAAATERVSVFAEALDGLGRSAGPLLLIAAAIIAVGEAFSFLKDGVEEAAKSETYFATIGQAVKNQGGNWDTAKEGLERFLDALEKSTTYSRGEALAAINELVASGTSLSDSEKIVAIATDVAAASHRSLTDVVDRVKEAEAGRGMGLVQLDEKLKTLVHTHGDLSAALNQLAHDDMGAAEAAALTYEGKLERLRNEIDHIGEELGERLLPILGVAAVAMLQIADEVEKQVPKWSSWADNAVEAIGVILEPLKNLHDNLSAVDDLLNKWGDNLDALGGQNLHGSTPWYDNKGGGFGENLAWGQAPPGVTLGGDGPASSWMSQMSAQYASQEASWSKQMGAYKSQPLQNDVQLGEPGKGSGGGSNPALLGTDEWTTATQKLEAAQKQLDDALRDTKAGEDLYTEAATAAKGTTNEQAAAMAAAKEKQADARQEYNLLAAAIETQTRQLAAATAAQNADREAATHLQEAHDALARTVAASGTATKEQTRELEDLERAHAKAKKGADDQAAAITFLTNALEQNRQKQQELYAATHAVTTEVEAQTKALDAQVDAWEKSLAESAKQVEAEKERRATAIEGVQTEDALYGTSLQQQLAFYEARYANEVAADKQYLDQGTADFNKIISIESQEYKERLDQHNAFIKDEQNAEEEYLGIILAGHKSLRDELKDIWDDIEKQLLKTVEKMIIDSKLISGINSALAGVLGGTIGGSVGAGGGAAATGGIDSAASSYGIFGATLGPQGAERAISSLPTQSGVIGYLTGTTGAQQTSSIPLAGDASGMAGTYVKSAGSSTVNVTEAGSALAGAGIGGAVASVDGGNSVAGGILGAAAGLLKFGGPYGAAIGFGVDALAGFIGSELGPHWGPASNYPDRSNTAAYGSFLTNWQGSNANVNGNLVTPNIANNTAFGGTSISSEIESWVQSSSADPSSLSPGEQALLKQFQALGPNIGIAGESNGMFTLGDGKNVSVQTLMAMEQAYQSAVGGSSNSPVFQLSRSYPDLNISTLSSQVGSVNTQTGAYAPSSSTYGVPGSTGATNQVVLNVENLIGNDIPDNVAQTIAKKLRQLTDGVIAGGWSATSRANRARSN